MRTRPALALAALLALAGVAPCADEKSAKVAEQKKAASSAWDSLDAGDPATLETRHLLIYAPKASARRLKDAGVLLERYHDLAFKALGLDPKKDAYPGKVTVYLLADRAQFTAFVRRVERRRVADEGTASFSSADDRLHAAAYASAARKGVRVEAQAGEQLAALLLARKVGRTPLPDWLPAGFARATSYRASPRDRWVLEERKLARALARVRGADDVWGGKLEPAEAAPLQGSLADFLAYGPGAARFPAILDGFKPEEGMRSKTTAQALESAKLTPDRVAKLWKAWALGAR